MLFAVLSSLQGFSKQIPKMAISNRPQEVFEFSGFHLEVGERRLMLGQEAVQLPPKEAWCTRSSVNAACSGSLR